MTKSILTICLLLMSAFAVPKAQAFGGLLVTPIQTVFTAPVGDASEAKGIQFTNQQNLLVTITDIVATNTRFQITNNTCIGLDLALLETCSFEVSYEAVDEVPTLSDLVVTASINGGPPTELPAYEDALAGSGSPDQVAIINPANIDFPSTVVGGSSEVQTILVSNIGLSDLTLTGFEFVGDTTEFSVVQNQCPAGTILAPAQSCLIEVASTPTITGGAAATLNIDTDDLDNPLLSTTLVGTGSIANAAVIEFLPKALDFDEINFGDSTSQDVTLTNVGDQDLIIDDIFIGGVDASAFSQTNNCTNPIVPGASCVITVTFTAPGDGNFNGELTVVSNDPNSPGIVQLFGSTFFANAEGSGCSLNPAAAPSNAAMVWALFGVGFSVVLLRKKLSRLM